MIKITIYNIDGSMQTPWEENSNFIDKLYQLEEMGYKGKYLLDTLITDDWGVPPSSVIIEGIYKNEKVKRMISYE
ncbi:hypothetical protein LPB137_08115 [Poseidonibacter parvus]|uniref:Uncharacterized protein n=1 Tax=Poseidonibacter parvus TaxID=1850254 RepID=A0A1P8KMN7_9BACT|nr:hypothetical protein [Poseidonibacter parvus]APW65821.1 hypothetical protein LPB137_08115 [Poseidonibacter parvus]